MIYTTQSNPEQDPRLRQLPGEIIERTHRLASASQIAKNSAAIAMRTADSMNAAVTSQQDFQVNIAQPTMQEARPAPEIVNSSMNAAVTSQQDFQVNIAQPTDAKSEQLRSIRDSLAAIFEEAV